MSDDVLRADPRLRRTTLAIVGVAAVLAVLGVFCFQQWLTSIGEQPGTDLLILRLRRMIALALTGSAICLALLAWYSAHKGTRAVQVRQWPLPGALLPNCGRATFMPMPRLGTIGAPLRCHNR